jgi:cobalamin-dependent methionine synthase I
VASDALGSALAEQMADAAEAELRQWAAGQGRYLTGRYSPGYGDWPITVQPLVAAALDTARRAGLCVTDSNLMTPRKSVTALLGVSDHPVRGHLAGCGHCVLRTRCEYRKRGITCASE